MILREDEKTFFSCVPSKRFRAVASTDGVSRSHILDKPHSSGGEISPTQKPLSDNTQNSQQRDFHDSGGIRTHNPTKRAAADPHLRRPGHKVTADKETLGESPVQVPRCPPKMN